MGGSQIMCTIIALGPDLSKLAYKSAWCMHPQCNEIAVLSNGYPTPPKRKFCESRPRFFNSKIPEVSSPQHMETYTARVTALSVRSARSDSLLRRCAGAPFSEEG